jgi:hypothetical protein
MASPPRATRTGSPSGSGSQAAPFAQSELLEQTAKLGGEQLVAQADVAVTPTSTGLPASIPIADAPRPRGMLAQQAWPPSQSRGPEHANCKGLAQVIRSTHVPISPDRQQVSPCPQPRPPNGKQAVAASGESPPSVFASVEGWESRDGPHAARLTPNETPSAWLKAPNRVAPTLRRVARFADEKERSPLSRELEALLGAECLVTRPPARYSKRSASIGSIRATPARTDSGALWCRGQIPVGRMIRRTGVP